MGGNYIIEEIYLNGMSRIRTPANRLFLCQNDRQPYQLRPGDLEPAAYQRMIGKQKQNPYFTRPKGFETPEDALTAELYEKKAFLDKLSVEEAQRSDWRERGAMPFATASNPARSNRQ